jgi:formate dehydrogenase
MTPHTSGTSPSARARYAAGTREIFECWFESRPIRPEYLIVDGGKLAGAGRIPTTWIGQRKINRERSVQS